MAGDEYYREGNFDGSHYSIPREQYWERRLDYETHKAYHRGYNDGGRIKSNQMNTKEEINISEPNVVVSEGFSTEATALAVPIKGIDTSHWQGDIDWSRVPAEYKFVFVKSTDGAHDVDKTFYRNFIGAWKTKRHVAPYIFVQPLQNPETQIAAFLQEFASTGKKLGDLLLPPALDIEWVYDRMKKNLWNKLTLDQRIDVLARLIGALEKSIGRKPIIYTSNSFMNESFRKPNGKQVTGNAHVNFGECPLWLNNFPKKIMVPDAWAKSGYTIRQYTDKGRVIGIPDNTVDLNTYNPDSNFFRELMK